MSTLWTPSGEHRVPPAPSSSTPPPRSATGAPGEQPGAPGEQPGAPAGRARQPAEHAGPGQVGRAPTPEEVTEAEADLDAMREELARTPAEVVVANHALGLWELAALHLSQKPPQLQSARLAIDALAALVEGMSGRLGEAEQALQEGLAQLRMAFVQISNAERTKQPGGAGPS